MASKSYTDKREKAQPPRKSLSKKVRFEVFKRDGFACQYCGQKAPNVLLHVDHINPVSKGGSNDILNLITACQECNLGKGKRKLSDDTPLQAQLDQARVLNDRREQLEMLSKWVDEIGSIRSQEIDLVVKLYNQKVEPYGLVIGEIGVSTLDKAVKKFGLKEVVTAMDAAAETYLSPNKTDHVSMCEKFINSIPKICHWNAKGGVPVERQRMFYIRGILRNRLHYVNDRVALMLLENAVAAGADLNEVEDFAKSVGNWSDFRRYCEQICENGAP